MLVSWFIFWFWIDRFVKGFKLDFKDKLAENDFINRIASMTHGFAIFIVSLINLYSTERNYSAPSSAPEERMIYFSISYFIYDLVAMKIYGCSNLGIEIHHFVCIGAFIDTLFSGFGGRFIMLCCVYAEISNPPMHSRKILDLVGMRYTKLRNLCQNSYFMLYGMFRTVGGVQLLMIWYNSGNIPMTTLLMGVALMAISISTMPGMISLFKIEMKIKRKLKTMGAKKWWFSENPKITENRNFIDSIANKNDEKVF